MVGSSSYSSLFHADLEDSFPLDGNGVLMFSAEAENRFLFPAGDFGSILVPIAFIFAHLELRIRIKSKNELLGGEEEKRGKHTRINSTRSTLNFFLVLNN
jgi:hypothetical protein